MIKNPVQITVNKLRTLPRFTIITNVLCDFGISKFSSSGGTFNTTWTNDVDNFVYNLASGTYESLVFVKMAGAPDRDLNLIISVYNLAQWYYTYVSTDGIRHINRDEDNIIIDTCVTIYDLPTYSLTINSGNNLKQVQDGSTIYTQFPATIPITANKTLTASGEDDKTITINYDSTNPPVVINT